MASNIPIAIAHGDGIGPEIMQAVLHVLKAANAPLDYQVIEVGEKQYLKGVMNGIDPNAWDIIRKTKAFLKAPITTPQGGGYKSINVTIRTTMGLYANVRPCIAYTPFVATKHPEMDVVIVRENEEDLYVGVEYQQTPEVCKSLKMISESGSERIIRYAFEYAKSYKRKKVTCFTKDNVLKLSDGLFHKTFEKIAKEYPEIENEHWIVDIGAAKLADTPEAFDVVVMPNLYGDILSDVAAQISGSVGIAGSANIGAHGAMFEAIHGSAPRRAGQDVANPSGLLLASVMMLVHLGLSDTAETIHHAWSKTIEEGIHTYDIFKEGVSKKKVGTQAFAEAVAQNLGKKPEKLPVVKYSSRPVKTDTTFSRKKVSRTLTGVDVFVYSEEDLVGFTKKIEGLKQGALSLEKVFNRGTVIWPEGHPETHCVDQFRLRFSKKGCAAKDVVKLLSEMVDAGFDVISSENLYEIN